MDEEEDLACSEISNVNVELVRGEQSNTIPQGEVLVITAPGLPNNDVQFNDVRPFMFKEEKVKIEHHIDEIGESINKHKA